MIFVKKKLNNYVHNYQIKDDQSELKDYEYYTCVNGVSNLHNCEKGQMFDNSKKSCVNKNRCLGMGYSEIILNSNNYIQCENDVGKLVHCPNGIRTVDNHVRCFARTCNPNTQYFENDVLKFPISNTTCTYHDEAIETNCDIENIDKVIKFTFGIDFEYKFKYWPRSIYHIPTVIFCTSEFKDTDRAALY